MEWWHRTKKEILAQLDSPLPDATQYEKTVGRKLSMQEIRKLKKQGRIK